MNYFKNISEILEDFKNLNHEERGKELSIINRNYHMLSKSDIALIGEETTQTKNLSKLLDSLTQANLEMLSGS